MLNLKLQSILITFLRLTSQIKTNLRQCVVSRDLLYRTVTLTALVALVAFLKLFARINFKV